MSPGPSLERDSLVLIHAPVGRDAHLLHDLLHRAKLQSQVCLNIEHLCGEVEKGAGAIFVTEEALEEGGIESLAGVLQKQGQWSDLPLVVLTIGGEPTQASRQRLERLEPLGDLTLLERPLRSDTIVSAARTALRARAKQYEVRRRDAELQLVTDNVPVLISYLDSAQVYRRVNQTYYEWFGKRPDEIVGHTLKAVIGEPHYTVARPFLIRALAGERVSFESRLLDKDRKLRYVSVSYAPDVAPNGDVRGIVALLQDITERKGNERRNAFLVQLDDATRPLTDPDAITLSAARLLCECLDVSRCAYANVEADQDTFNLTGDYNRGVASIVGRYRFSEFGDECLRLMREGEPFVVEDAATDSRTAAWMEAYRSTGIRSVICVPLHKQGRLVAAMAVHQNSRRNWNVREVELVELVASRCWESIERARVLRELRRTNADLMRANSELEEFAYVSSHDLQEPLRMVNSYTQLMLKRLGPQADDDLRKFAEYIRTGIRRMEALIRDLLSYSRATHAGNDTPEMTADLSAALRQALHRVDTRIQENHAEVTFDSLPQATGDEGQLSHVFQNLLSNALKYRNQNEAPRIHIRAEQVNGDVVVSVRDNGIGFDPAQAERIFGLFKRLHREEDYPGTGLGLAICKRIVERYGGKMWAKGEEGAGATFFISLPGVNSE